MPLARLPAIHRLRLGKVTCPDFHPTPSAEVELFAYLVEHPAGLVLVDTGMGDDNDFLNGAYRPRLVPLAEALAACGHRPSDVVALVNSHLHFDHCGNNRLLRGVPTWLQSAEVAAARQPHYTVREWFDFEGAALRFVDGEAELLPGLRLVPTPGHTPGHQSLLVEGGGRRALVGAQAVYTLDEWTQGPDLAQAATGLAERYRASYEHLRRLAPDELYLSHDPRSGAAAARSSAG
jgi:N-acyl homoserine lactone hydrolase